MGKAGSRKSVRSEKKNSRKEKEEQDSMISEVDGEIILEFLFSGHQ